MTSELRNTSLGKRWRQALLMAVLIFGIIGSCSKDKVEAESSPALEKANPSSHLNDIVQVAIADLPSI